MGAYGLVIFDNDGVVVDSEPLAARAMSETLGSVGVAMTAEECDRAFRGGSLRRDRQVIEAMIGTRLPPEFERRVMDRLMTFIAEGLQPVAGIEEVLDRIEAAHLPYCLASSGRREKVGFALEKAGLASRFAGRWWGAEDVPKGKPAPDLFLLASSSMGMPPDRCVVVEDSVLGVQAARAAGMTVLGFAASGITPAERLAGADRVFEDMSELPALLLA